MRPNYCLTILLVSSLAVLLFFTLEADGDNSDCVVEVRVRHNTIYVAALGEDLKIHCPVTFCNHPPPTVTWYKLEKTGVPVNVSSSSRITTEWKLLKHLEGRSLLIFQKILRSDSGVYRCQSGGSLSHNIKVTVNDDDMHTTVTTVTWTTSKPETIESSWRYVYHVVRITLFVILVITFCVALMCGCKGKSRDTKSRRQPSHDALPTTHIYDNIPLSAP